MSKKNNKNKSKQYVQRLKELESRMEKEANKRQMKKEIKRKTYELIEDIEDINLEKEKEETMDIEKNIQSTHKKRISYRNKKKKKRYN